MKRVFTLLLTLWVLGAAAQTLLINELMQSNIDCLMDDLNDYPDSWVELYNPSDGVVSLQGYKIGTGEDASTAWALPAMSVGAHRYVVVYCDKAGGDDGVSSLHTDFRLESGKGCNVYLFKDGQVADRVVNLPKQPAPNIAYGRKTDGGGEWGYLLAPTPNGSNYGQLSAGMLGEPVFSEKGMVVTGADKVAVTLSLPEKSPAGTVIRYTLNGSEPTESSAVYAAPFSFNSTQVLRAKLFCEGYLSPRSTCHSYIFFPKSRQLTLPVISIVTDNKHLNDAKKGILVEGSYSKSKKNYEYNWRRPANIEYFEKGDEGSRLNQLCETRVAGGASRGASLKTLAVYAHKRFGTKRLAYEFFPDQKPGLKDFKSLMLRNSGNDFDYLYMRDAIIQRTMASHVDMDWQAWRPAIIYINGQYKGMLNIRERSNEDNVYSNYDGLEDIDMFENWWELKEGDWDNYNAFRNFYAAHGHTLAEYSEWMDWEEFINLMAMNLYYNNLDFPGNNIVIWRPREAGGKWRWIAKDTDFGLGLYGTSYDYKTLEWLYYPNYDGDHNWGANSYEATRLFRRLMEDADFKREFIDRTCIYMGDFLNEAGTLALWEPMYEQIKTEFPAHRKLYQYNQWWPRKYEDEMADARNWLKYRTNAFYTQIGNYYQLGTPIALTINKGQEDQLKTLVFNGIALSKQVFDGRFFANRQMTVTGEAQEGREITGWKVTTTQTREYSGSVLSIQMPQASSVTIQPILGEASGISEVRQEPAAQADGDIYDLTGRKVANPRQGVIYIRNGKKFIGQ